MPGYFRGVSLISAVSNVDGNYPLHNRLIDDQGNNRILFRHFSVLMRFVSYWNSSNHIDRADHKPTGFENENLLI